MKNDRFEMRFADDERKKLEKLAQDQRKSKAAIIRKLINFAFQNPRIIDSQTGQ